MCVYVCKYIYIYIYMYMCVCMCIYTVTRRHTRLSAAHCHKLSKAMLHIVNP